MIGSRAMTLSFLFKVSAGNVNSSYNEGNVLVAKKLTLPDGSYIPYISGQALRRMLRDRLSDLGWELSEPHAKVEGQNVRPPAEPNRFIDEDLFGYLDASGSKRRTSPVRVSAAVGLFAFQGDKDLGTRSFEKFGEATKSGGNIFETEVYHNVFRATILVELDRVGVFTARELTGKEKGSGNELSPSEKAKRLKALFEALRLLWGGGRTARMLCDLSPRLVAYARLKAKHPIFLEALQLEHEGGDAYSLRIEPVADALKRFSRYLDSVAFGWDKGFMRASDALEESLRGVFSGEAKVLPLDELFDFLDKEVDLVYGSGLGG